MDYHAEMSGSDGAVEAVLSVGSASAVMRTATRKQAAAARQAIDGALARHGNRLALAASLVTARRAAT